MKKLILLLILINLSATAVQRNQNLQRENLEVLMIKTVPFSSENLLRYLQILNIDHPYIVYKQAILETGRFTSNIFKTKNNLFGLCKNGRCIKFSHWTHSVEFYAKLQQKTMKKHYKGCYYSYLSSMKYAEDPLYIQKLKSITY